MENNQTAPAKTGTTKKVLLGLGGLVLGTLAFFGIKKLTNTKKQKQDDNNDKEGESLDTEKPVQTAANNLPRTNLPAHSRGDSFPLAVGSKGQRVKTLQQSLIGKFGAGVLAKFGADGYFGDELATALRDRGYKIPLQEEAYNSITKETKEQGLKSFDALSVAKGLWTAIVSKDYSSALTLLKSIGNPGNYSLVSEHFKQFFIAGVRHTIVNAMLKFFDEKSQKENTKQVLLEIGLKYNPQTDKWTLNGMNGVTKKGVVVTLKKCTAYRNGTNRNVFIILPSGVTVGEFILSENGFTFFKLLDTDKVFHVADASVKVEAKDDSLSGVKSKLKEGDKVAAIRQVLISSTNNNYLVVPEGMFLGKWRYEQNGIAYIDTGIGREIAIKQEFIKKIN